MKRFTAGLLAVVMLVLLLPAGVFAAEANGVTVSVKENLAYAELSDAVIKQASNGGCANFDFSKENTKGINAKLSAGLLNDVIVNYNDFSIAIKEKFVDAPGKQVDLKVLKSDKKLPESIEKVNGTRPVIDVFAKTDKDLTYFDKSLSITIPYEASSKEKENLRALTVWAIDSMELTIPIVSAQYDDENKTITFDAKVCGTYVVVYNEPSFEDNKNEPSNYAYDYINFLGQKGAIKGTTDTTFSPFNEIIRGDVMLLVMRATGVYGEIGEYFSDTPKDKYYSSTIAMARALGIATGVSENEFEPQNEITRQDFFTTISRALDIAYPGVYTNTNTECLKEYSDYEDVADYAKQHTAKLMNYGIVNGNDGRILPKDNITRREVATVFAKLYKRYDNGNKNLSEGGKYYISYPGQEFFSGDMNLKALTDGKKGGQVEVTGENGWLVAHIENQGVFAANLPEAKLWEESYDGIMDPQLYIKHDFMTLSDVTAVEVNFGANKEKNIKIPEKVEFVFSNDGVNYTVYGGEAKIVKGTENTATYRLDLEMPVMAKAVKVVFYGADNSYVAMDEIKVIGKRRYEVQKASSKDGVKYSWNGSIVDSSEPISNQVLLDGKYYEYGDTTSKKYHTATTINNVKNPVTGVKSQIITFDFGKEVNIAQLDLTFLSEQSSRNPDYVVAMYGSDDDVFFAKDFGQSFVMTEMGNGNSQKYYYSISRNNTVKARYLFVILENAGRTSIDEADIYLTEKPQEEPDYGFERYDNMLYNTNILEGTAIKVDNKETRNLTDGSFQVPNSRATVFKKEATITGKLDKSYDKLVGTEFYFLTESLMDTGRGAPCKIETYLSSDGENYNLVSSDMRVVKTGTNYKVNQFFDNSKGEYFKIVITPNEGDTLKLSEIQIYNEQVQLPIIRGGFFQLTYTGTKEWVPMEKYTDTAWYNQLKGMKEMGMDHVVMQMGAIYYNKGTVIPNKKLEDLGYKYKEGMGSYDAIKAVLEAAEKLDMKVYLGTIHTYGSYGEIVEHGGLSHIKKVASDGKVVMDALMENYKDYKSFEGFYLSDETCDTWLTQNGATAAYRTLYKTQSDYAHSKYPEKKIMISPAMWKTGGAVAAEKNLCNLLKPDKEGERPVVDIVSAQDCLGRYGAYILDGSDIYFNQKVLSGHQIYVDAWARGIKNAGVEFWCDMEAGNFVTFFPKPMKELTIGMEIASKHTNGAIIFDIPTCFSPLARKTYNDMRTFRSEATIDQYVKHYQEFKDLNYQNN